MSRTQSVSEWYVLTAWTEFGPYPKSLAKRMLRRIRELGGNGVIGKKGDTERRTDNAPV